MLLLFTTRVRSTGRYYFQLVFSPGEGVPLVLTRDRSEVPPPHPFRQDRGIPPGQVRGSPFPTPCTGQEGTPTAGPPPTTGEHTTPRAVRLLWSRRRTFLFCIILVFSTFTDVPYFVVLFLNSFCSAEIFPFIFLH